MSTFSPHFSYFLLNARFFANCPRLHGELISGFFPGVMMKKLSTMSREKVFVLAWLRHTAVYHSLYHRRGWTD